MTVAIPAASPGAREIEIWFDFASPYSYLAVMRVASAAEPLGVRVVWKPFLLGPVFKALGWSDAPFVIQKEKGAYMWKDMERQCRKYGLPWRWPETFPRLALLPARVALAGVGQPWVGEFCRRVMTLHFGAGREVNINAEAEVAAVLAEMGLPVSLLIAEANSHGLKQRLKEQTETARRSGIFGAPTLFVGDEMYWGNDRLDDALALAAGGSA